jgi:hypothetical protein
MDSLFVRCGQSLINIASVDEAHWEREKLFIHFHGGAFQGYSGIDAKMIWSALQQRSTDLLTGEVKDGEQ